MLPLQGGAGGGHITLPSLRQCGTAMPSATAVATATTVSVEEPELPAAAAMAVKDVLVPAVAVAVAVAAQVWLQSFTISITTNSER